MCLEDESGHAEGGSGGTSDVHGRSSAGEVGGLGAGGSGASARCVTRGLGGNGTVVVGSGDNRCGRDGNRASLDQCARTILNGLYSWSVSWCRIGWLKIGFEASEMPGSIFSSRDFGRLTMVVGAVTVMV